MDMPDQHVQAGDQGRAPADRPLVSLSSNISVEILAGSGFDWLLLDTEHSPERAADGLQPASGGGGGTAHPIVRPPWNDMVMIKRFLDAGVQTFLIPYVQNAEEARQAVACDALPAGRRSRLRLGLARVALRPGQGLLRAGGGGNLRAGADRDPRGAGQPGSDRRRAGRRRRVHRSRRPVGRHGLPGPAGPSRT